MEAIMHHNYYTAKTQFYGNVNPKELLEKYGSPLYVYSEAVLRKCCRDMKNLVPAEGFTADYSIKANSNLHILEIVREEGLEADAMSPGEIHVLLEAGFRPDQILFVCNNVSAEEMRFAVERGITVSVDSLMQLDTYGKNFPGTKVAARFNTGYGAGHHEKVVTAGKKTKFGINDDKAGEVKLLLQKHNLKLCGINQHIGSLFMEESAYVASCEALLDLAMQFEDLEFVDMGGGFGIPYRKQDGERQLDLAPFAERIGEAIANFKASYPQRKMKFKTEPGRYVVAESCVLLGTVHSIKDNNDITYVGTDLGFNVLQRPVMYDSHHDIEVYREGKLSDEGRQTVTVVGNICESGDKLAVDRTLPRVQQGDILGVMDAGAYGYSMSSNYNNRLRPAEVMIGLDGRDKLIRRRDTFEDLLRGF
jgi:diaminopimelate decarboxylase